MTTTTFTGSNRNGLGVRLPAMSAQRKRNLEKLAKAEHPLTEIEKQNQSLEAIRRDRFGLKIAQLRRMGIVGSAEISTVEFRSK